MSPAAEVDEADVEAVEAEVEATEAEALRVRELRVLTAGVSKVLAADGKLLGGKPSGREGSAPPVDENRARPRRARRRSVADAERPMCAKLAIRRPQGRGGGVGPAQLTAQSAQPWAAAHPKQAGAEKGNRLSRLTSSPINIPSRTPVLPKGIISMRMPQGSSEEKVTVVAVPIHSGGGDASSDFMVAWE